MAMVNLPKRFMKRYTTNLPLFSTARRFAAACMGRGRRKAQDPETLEDEVPDIKDVARFMYYGPTNALSPVAAGLSVRVEA